jgi:hypothetical protein
MPDYNLNSNIENLDEEFEEQMRRRYGDSSSGKRHSDHHGNKTTQHIQHEIIQSKIDKEIRSAEEEIFKVLLGFPEFDNKDLEDRYVDHYLSWLKNCFNNHKLAINPQEDIELDFIRSSSHGGQNVNKVETAARALHKITNLQVKNEEYSSQSENRKHAVILLVDKLKQHLVDWKEYLHKKDVNELSRYDILELMEQALLESKR